MFSLWVAPAAGAPSWRVFCAGVGFHHRLQQGPCQRPNKPLPRLRRRYANEVSEVPMNTCRSFHRIAPLLSKRVRRIVGGQATTTIKNPAEVRWNRKAQRERLGASPYEDSHCGPSIGAGYDASRYANRTKLRSENGRYNNPAVAANAGPNPIFPAKRNGAIAHNSSITRIAGNSRWNLSPNLE
jgi:hypothetical protein